MYKLHGLPFFVLSDRGPQFASQVTLDLFRLLKITRQLSSGHQPQTDGQTERINQILEQYLRAYCDYQQDNWADLLSTVEFSYNNTISSTIGMTPFFANYGFHPRYEIILRDGHAPPPESELVDYQDQLAKLEEYLRTEMKYAQAVASENANRKRSSPPVFKVGDEVWLLRRNFCTTRPSDKLDWKRVGKYKVLSKVSSHAYKLELPRSMKIHPVFHISRLEPAASDPLPDQPQPDPLPIEVDGKEEFLVDKILNSRLNRRRLQYLVRWQGDYPDSWEPVSFLDHTP